MLGASPQAAQPGFLHSVKRSACDTHHPDVHRPSESNVIRASCGVASGQAVAPGDKRLPGAQLHDAEAGGQRVRDQQAPCQRRADAGRQLDGL